MARKPSSPGIPGAVIERPSARAHRDHAVEIVEIDDGDFIDEEFSETHPVEDLPKLRGSRPTDIRFAHIEKNQDEIRSEMKAHRTELNNVKVAVADMGGQMKVIPDLVDAMKNATTELQKRDHVTFTAKVDVDKARAMDEIKDNEAKRADTLDANKTKREWVTKGIAIVSSVVAIVATSIAAGRC